MSKNITFDNVKEALHYLLGDTFKHVTFSPWVDQRNGKGWDALITVEKAGFDAAYIFDTNPVGMFNADFDDVLAELNPHSDDIHYFVPTLVFV